MAHEILTLKSVHQTENTDILTSPRMEAHYIYLAKSPETMEWIV